MVTINLEQYQTVRPLPLDVAAKVTKRIQKKVDSSQTVAFFQQQQQQLQLHQQQLHQQQQQQQQEQEHEHECCRPNNIIRTIPHFSDLTIGECLGQGSFSSVFTIKKSIKSIVATSRDEHDARDDDVDSTTGRCSNNNINNNSDGADTVETVPSVAVTDNTNWDNLVVKVLQPKLLAQPRLFANCAAGLIQEGLLLAALNHPNIVKVHAWSGTDSSGYASGRHDGHFLVMDRLSMTLKQKLVHWRQRHLLQEDLALRSFVTMFSASSSNSINNNNNNNNNNNGGGCYSRGTSCLKERIVLVTQLADAVRYLHSHRILHRDLKPDNLAVDSYGVLKVFDFDIARIVPLPSPPCRNNDDGSSSSSSSSSSSKDSQQQQQTFQLTRRMGSPRYMSPEVALGQPYNLAADVYAFGLLCHELLTLQRPYAWIPAGLHDQYVFGKQSCVRPVVPSSWPSKVRSLVQRCWAADLTHRPDMEEVYTIVCRELPTLLPKRDRPPPSSCSSSSSSGDNANENTPVNNDNSKKKKKKKSRTIGGQHDAKQSPSVTTSINSGGSSILAKLGRRRWAMMVMMQNHHNHRGRWGGGGAN